MTDRGNITKGIANESYQITRIFQPYQTDKVWPIGCTNTHAFIVLEDQAQKTFRLAILKISSEIFKTPYACDIVCKGSMRYEEPWNVVPNHFFDYKAACIFRQYVCIFMAKQFCVFNGQGMVKYRFQQEFSVVHSCDMNDQYLIVSYETATKKPHFSIYQFIYPNVCELYYETEWPSIITHCALSTALAPNTTYLKHLVFFNDSHEGVTFKVWDIGDEKPFFVPNPNIDEQVTLDEGYRTTTLFVLSFNQNRLIVQASLRDLFMYNPITGVETFPTPKYPMANAHYWNEQSILITQDCTNNLHFFNFGPKTILLDDMNGQCYQADLPPETGCEMLGMLRENVITAPMHVIQEEVPRPSFPYRSLMTIGDKAFGFLLPDGTFNVIQPVIPTQPQTSDHEVC